MSDTKESKLQIVRDNNFVRISADDAFIADIGSCLDIGLIQYGPNFKEYSENGHHEVIKNQNILTEVARLRMDYPSITKFVMRIIQTGIKNDKFDADAIISSILEMKNKGN